MQWCRAGAEQVQRCCRGVEVEMHGSENIAGAEVQVQI